MAHLYESTLLARLGFADPDRRNPLHDAACQYLASSAGRRAVLDLFKPADRESGNPKTGVRHVTTHVLDYHRAERERTIAKGSGPSRFAVGFLDVVIHAQYAQQERFIEEATGKMKQEWRRHISRPFLVEVKIAKENIGQILRQVNLYRDFIDTNLRGDMAELEDYKFVVATRLEPTQEELKTLEAEDILHVLLGQGFDRYLAQAGHAPRRVTLNEI